MSIELVPRRLGADLLHRRRRRARAAQPAGDPALPRADAQRGEPRAGRLLAHARQRRRPDLRAHRDGRRRLRGRGRPRPDRRDLTAAGCRSTSTSCGSCRADAPTSAWLVLLCPLAGVHRHRARLRSCCRGACTAGSARSRSRSRSCAAVGALIALQDRGEEERQVVSVAWDYAITAGVDAQLSILVDPLSVFMMLRRHRRLDADPPLLGRLHGVRPRLHALLRVPELLRVLDAAAGPGRQLPAADRRLGVRRRGVLPADLVLVPAHDRDGGRHQGVRHQRRRRRRPRARHVLHPSRAPARSTSWHVRGGRPRRSRPTTATSSRAASCCSSARSRSPPRSRCTPGSRTRWRARRRSPP